VRTTLTLDDDVACLLEKEVKRSGQPTKQVVNKLLRCGLAQAAAPVVRKPFKVKPFNLTLPPEWTSGSTQELLNMLDGPLAR
jgi:hypothetical protein